MPQEIPSVDQREHRSEQEVLDFHSYELFCNQNNQSSRKSGILSDEIYDASLADPSTVFSEIRGVRVPVLVDIKYGLGLGYDEDRARNYAGSEDIVSALAVPVGDLDPETQATVVETIAASGQRAVFFADNEGRDQAALATGLSETGFDEIPLLDRRCRPQNRQASLSLFVSDNVLDRETAPEHKRTLADVQAYFNETMLPDIEDPANAAVLRNGASFSPEELEDIWQLYLNKFELLGENHPISMEDSREDFLGLLTDPSMMVSVRSVEGKPACFTYFTEDFTNLYWLNGDYLQKTADEAPELTPLFFPGIVADRASGNYAEEVIGLFAKAAAGTGMDARIIFENTNLSEMYVPRIVQSGIGEEPRYDVGVPQKVDQTTYRLAYVN